MVDLKTTSRKISWANNETANLILITARLCDVIPRFLVTEINQVRTQLRKNAEGKACVGK